MRQDLDAHDKPGRAGNNDKQKKQSKSADEAVAAKRGRGAKEMRLNVSSVASEGRAEGETGAYK